MSTPPWRWGWGGFFWEKAVQVRRRILTLPSPSLPHLTCQVDARIESAWKRNETEPWSLRWRIPPSDPVSTDWRSKKRRGTSRRDTRRCGRSALELTGQFGEWRVSGFQQLVTRNVPHSLWQPLLLDMFSCHKNYFSFALYWQPVP